MTVEQIRRVNDAIGVDTFKRLHELDLPTYNSFCDLLLEAGIDLHRDGFLGFTMRMTDDSWSNEGFQDNWTNEDSQP